MKSLKATSWWQSSTPWGYAGIILAAMTVLGTYWLVPPYFQNEAYHHFTDTRSWGFVPNTWNVLSNLPFLGVGILGMWMLIRVSKRNWNEHLHWMIYFAGVTAVAFGSAYYHWRPNNQTLIWDRLPMTWAFMGLLAAAMSRHFRKAPVRVTMMVLLLLGMASLWVWYRGSIPGSGDLRLYGLIQFGGSGLAILWFLTSDLPVKAKKWVIVSAIFYTAAKMAEYGDNRVAVILGHYLSGHTIKHFLSAVAAAVYLPVMACDLYRKTGSEVFLDRTEIFRIKFKSVLVGAFVIILMSVSWVRFDDTFISRGGFWPWPMASDYAYPPEVERVSFPSEDGTILQAWWIPTTAKGRNKQAPLLLLLHGNGGNLAVQYEQFHYLGNWGYDVLALDYRGFGASEGTPSRDGIREDSVAALEYIRQRFPNRKVAVVGHSMGTVFAMQLAARRIGVDKVVLLAPLTAFDEMGENALRNMGMTPLLARWIARLVIPRKMDPIRAANTMGLPPILIVHGTADRIIPFEMGRRVFEAYRGPKTWLTLDGYGHENFHEGPKGNLYRKTLEGFLSFSYNRSRDIPPLR